MFVEKGSDSIFSSQLGFLAVISASQVHGERRAARGTVSGGGGSGAAQSRVDDVGRG